MKKVFQILSVNDDNIPPVIHLVNSAYRGESSRMGWTTEADIISGSLRVDLDAIKTMLQKQGAVILALKDSDEIIGCVYLYAWQAGLHMGMLSVSPALQGAGIGKFLLRSAEGYAREKGRSFIRMLVINIRYELIAWYERHGYILTGVTELFPDEEKFGKPNLPIQFVELKKNISEEG